MAGGFQRSADTGSRVRTREHCKANPMTAARQVALKGHGGRGPNDPERLPVLEEIIVPGAVALGKSHEGVLAVKGSNTGDMKQH